MSDVGYTLWGREERASLDCAWLRFVASLKGMGMEAFSEAEGEWIAKLGRLYDQSTMAYEEYFSLLGKADAVLSPIWENLRSGKWAVVP